MGIDELDKSAGNDCPHCLPQQACSIYEARPASCRSFQCQWLRNLGLPAAFRPDKTRVVLTVGGCLESPWLIANCEAIDPLAWKRDPIYPWLKEQARLSWGSGRAVLANAQDHFWLIAPSEDRDLGDIEDGAAIELEIGRRGKFAIRRSPPAALRSRRNPVGPGLEPGEV
jgi:hypothetical protein